MFPGRLTRVLKHICRNAYRNFIMMAPNGNTALAVEWINEGWYVHLMEYYPAEKMNRRVPHLKAWLNLTDESFERSQTQKSMHDFCF